VSVTLRQEHRVGEKRKKARVNIDYHEIDYGHARGLTKAQVLELSTSKWVESRQNVLLTGPTGVGKSFLACVLGQKACRDGYSGEATLADAILDRLVHNAHRLKLAGDSIRKVDVNLTKGRKQAK
jgi:DNA replication protein DnaC